MTVEIEDDHHGKPANIKRYLLISLDEKELSFSLTLAYNSRKDVCIQASGLLFTISRENSRGRNLYITAAPCTSSEEMLPT